jgi:hypothetical protein
VAKPRRLIFRLDDELVLCTGPGGRPLATVTARGMGALDAQRPLVVWDDVDEFRLTAGLPRGRIRRTVGIARLMLRDGEGVEQTPDPEVFPDRVHATWVFRRRNEPKEGGFGYVPRGVAAGEIAHLIDLLHAIAEASDADVRARLISSVPTR